ncbi:MAG: helix-turn-helix domain-containing protein, partial [Actinobacteria bacterium]|nr:helix-turn-helix domain-containing protein [Actinomycetota bacterium]
MLAASRGRVLTRDILIEGIWGGQLPADPAANLNVLVNRARRALDDPAWIQTTEGGYLLVDDSRVTVDVEQFEALVERARAAENAGDLSDTA